MKNWVFVVVGIVLVAIGLLWVLQGLDVISGSGMSGSKFWFAIGLLVGLAGIAGIVNGSRRLSASRR
jgi:hypothetical protein